MEQEGGVQILTPKSPPAVPFPSCHLEFSLSPLQMALQWGKPFLFVSNAIAFSHIDKALLVRGNRYPLKLVCIKGKERTFYKVTEISQKLARLASWELELLRWASLGDGFYFCLLVSLGSLQHHFTIFLSAI